MKWLFFQTIKVFWSIVAQKNKTKTKGKVSGVAEKYIKKQRNPYTHMMGSYPKEINVQNALEYS